MLKYKKGDLVEFTEDAFGHGCNCFKAMGSGVALVVKRVYPELYKADQFDQRKEEERFGGFSSIKLVNGKIGYNIYSQFKYGASGPRKVDYDKLKGALVLVCNDMKEKNLKSLALPKIGCGLAGGDWAVVEKILIEVSNSENIEIIVYEL